MVSPEEMAAADRATISSGTPAEVLMDRAGRAVARASLRLLGTRYGRRAVVVCGPGSNGGDGFVTARALSRAGMSVTCSTIGRAAPAESPAARHRARLAPQGVMVEPFDGARLAGCDVIVDALFGTGFHGSAEGEAASAIEAMNAASAPIVAVDIPSGITGSTGAADGPAIRAAVTVALAAEKMGTALPPGAVHAGGVEVADIGIPVDGPCAVVERGDVVEALPLRAPDAHKRSGGSVCLLAGSDAMSGAALLAARGAVRMGAGYATVGSTSAVTQVVAAVLPEVLSVVVGDGAVLGEGALERFADVLARADALAIGPGLGQGPEQSALVTAVAREVELPVVIDADGLNALAGSPRSFAGRAAGVVLTPHPGELARLLGTSAAGVQADRLDAARRAADRFGAVVLLKGYRTIVAEPAGRAVITPVGGPELATAGTGDVLTGVIVALLAADLDPFTAAGAGAYVHGLAGSVAASTLGTAGVLAWDVAEAIPRAVGVIRAEPLPRVAEAHRAAAAGAGPEPRIG